MCSIIYTNTCSRGGETMKGNKPVKKRDLFDIINRNGMEYIAALLAYAIALEKQMAKASAT